MNCPGCGTAEMVEEQYAGNYGVQLTIDVCHFCNGIWFDGRESLQLSSARCSSSSSRCTSGSRRPAPS
jgi:Zn-finger nucleic acid-binding protein